MQALVLWRGAKSPGRSLAPLRLSRRSHRGAATSIARNARAPGRRPASTNSISSEREPNPPVQEQILRRVSRRRYGRSCARRLRKRSGARAFQTHRSWFPSGTAAASRPRRRTRRGGRALRASITNARTGPTRARARGVVDETATARGSGPHGEIIPSPNARRRPRWRGSRPGVSGWGTRARHGFDCRRPAARWMPRCARAPPPVLDALVIAEAACAPQDIGSPCRHAATTFAPVYGSARSPALARVKRRVAAGADDGGRSDACRSTSCRTTFTPRQGVILFPT